MAVVGLEVCIGVWAWGNFTTARLKRVTADKTAVMPRARGQPGGNNGQGQMNWPHDLCSRFTTFSLSWDHAGCFLSIS